MKVSETWLRDLIHLPVSMATIMDQLTNAGIEVDSFERFEGTPENTVMNLKIPANRGDCLSMEGIIREIAVLNNLTFTGLETVPCFAKVLDTFPVTVLARKDCPRYVGRVIQNVQADRPVPEWIQKRLNDAGIRSISLIVDITNYVMLELGQPLHAFDLSKLEGEIVVRYASDGEQLLTLEDVTATLDSETLVIADRYKPLAIAGIMGGQSSGVGPSTRNVFLESAYFDPIRIRSVSKRLNIRSESSHRFERGVDPNLQVRAIERATQLILDNGGGNPGPITEHGDAEHLPKAVSVFVSQKKIQAILGICPIEEAEMILPRLGITTRVTGNGLEVSIPSFRRDILIDVDVIEEIARIYGYEKIPKVTPTVPFEFLPIPESKLDENRLKMALVERGYYEAITYSFLSPELDQLFTPDDSALRITNPISEELAIMRSSLWPGLLKAVQYNQRRGLDRIRLFETGLCFLNQQDPLEQREFLGGVAVGSVLSEQWSAAAKPLDFHDVKSDVEALLNLSRNSAIQFEATDHPSLHPGQSAAVVTYDQANNKAIQGYIGALHPALIKALDLKGPVFVFELALDFLTETQIPQFREVSKFPRIRRDIAVIVDKTVLAEELKSAIVNCVGDLAREVLIFDVYQGKGIESGRKSVALGLILQHPSRTLVESEVSDLIQKVIAELKTRYQAVLRE